MSEEEKTQKGSKKWLFIALGAVVVLLATGAALYFMGFFSAEEAEASEEAAIEVNEIMTLAPMVVNLADDSKVHYARISISLGIYNPQPGEVVIDEQLMIPKLKDRLLGTISQQTSTELIRPQVKESLKEEIRESVNELLEEGEGEILEVYFTEFIVQ